MPHDYGLRQIAPAQAELGESPVWDTSTGLLYFVDITQGQIKALTPQASLSTVYQSTARIGALALSDHGNLVFTENTRVCMLDTRTGTISRQSAAVHETASYRFNDGACDPQGPFVAPFFGRPPGYRDCPGLRRRPRRPRQSACGRGHRTGPASRQALGTGCVLCADA